MYIIHVYDTNYFDSIKYVNSHVMTKNKSQIKDNIKYLSASITSYICVKFFNV